MATLRVMTQFVDGENHVVLVEIDGDNQLNDKPVTVSYRVEIPLALSRAMSNTDRLKWIKDNVAAQRRTMKRGAVTENDLPTLPKTMTIPD